jgi:microcin C transport system substrate-binding protein
MLKQIGALAIAVLASSVADSAAFAQPGKPLHAIAIHGEPKYGPDFKHLDYVNPEAPRGGQVTLGSPGQFRTYDSLNGFILKGVPAAGLGLLYSTLLSGTGDDPEGRYGMVAESLEVPDDRSWVIFTLRPEARFNDGKAITAQDVAWTFETLMTKGNPQYRFLYADVEKAEALDDKRVKYTFKVANNRELPGMVGGLPILPRHYWQTRDFDKTTLEPPLGSGVYVIDTLDQGRSITYRRLENHWADKLPLMVGRYNFGSIKYDYYRDMQIDFEAFKGGSIDFREENTAKDWATAYDTPAVRGGLIKRDEIKNQNPARAQGFVFNTRRPIFQDRRVRQALGYGFDFEWLNKTLFYESYVRVDSHWANSELASRGLPEGEEKALLERYRGRIPDDVFTKEYRPPKTDGSGNIRDNLREGLRLFKEAGWENKGGKLVNTKGDPFQFEIFYLQSGLDRIILPFAKNLERFGVAVNVRIVDSAQYENRLNNFDFDMMIGGTGQSLSPGSEQRALWGSEAASTPGSANLGGVRDPVIDELVELVIGAKDRKELVVRTRALDRVLLWGFYMIPQYTAPNWRIAYWDKFGRPASPPKYAIGFLDTWWVDPAKAASLEQRKAGLKN